MNTNRCAFRFLLLLAVSFLVVGAANTEAADWPMFGRDETRNSVSLEKDPPIDWDISDFDEAGLWKRDSAKNVTWVARLGSNDVW